MRAFVGIKINLAVETELARVQKELQKQIKTAVWVKPANIHLTLAFFEKISEAQLALVQQVGRQVCPHYSPFELSLGQFNAFPNLKKTQILYLALAGESKKIAKLTQRLRQNFDRYHLPFDHQPFVPHLTLGRLKHPLDLTSLQITIHPVILPVTHLDLIDSRLKSSGPVYQTLITFYLNSSLAKNNARLTSSTPNFTLELNLLNLQ
jgi:2'-5' RNA ligase